MNRRVALLIVGLVGGLMSGLFGVGGGIVMVPMLASIAGLDHRRAAATSLAAIVPTSIAASIGYAANGAIDLVAAVLIGVGGIAGSQLGSRLLRRLSVRWLRWLFLALLLIVAVRMLLEVPSRSGHIALTPLSIGGLVLLGLAMGVASGLFGIGGGVLAVPVLIAAFGAGDVVAKGVSLAAMVLTALAGTVANWRARLVDPVDGAIVGIAAVVTTYAGVALSFALPERLASILFVALLVVSAAQLVIAGIREARAGRAG
jgi:uncharacterized protein